MTYCLKRDFALVMETDTPKESFGPAFAPNACRRMSVQHGPHSTTVGNAQKKSITISNQYIYDHMGRKLETWEQITNGSSTPDTRTLLSSLDYNEIGQVMTKNLNSTDSRSVSILLLMM